MLQENNAIELKGQLTESGEWMYQFVPNLSRGFSNLVREEDIEFNQISNGKNIITQQNKVLVDFGYVDFGDELYDNPRISFQFFLRSGTDYLCCITNSLFYTYNTSTEYWEPIKATTAVDTTVATAAVVADDTEFEVADGSGYSNGDILRIELDSGAYWVAAISNKSGNTLTMDTASPGVAAINNAVEKCEKLSGSDDDGVSVAVVTSQDWLVFTNNQDPPKRFDGSTVETLSNLPASLTKAKVVVQYGNYTFLLNTVEGGQDLPQKFHYTNDPTDWTGGGTGNGSLIETEDHIITANVLSNYLIIYKERSIVRVEFLGSTVADFSFETVVTGQGIIGIDCLANLGDFHIVLGQAALYKYNGGYDYEAVGNEIYYKLFSVNGELDPGNKKRSFIIYVEELDEIWVFYPSVGEEWPNKMLRYQFETDSWWPREYVTNFSGFGFYTTSTAKSWSSLSGSWRVQTSPWNAVKLTSNSPETHLLDQSGKVYTYDYSADSDDGTNISWFIETKDYYMPNTKIRIDYFDLKAAGGDVLIEYSVDEGNNWVEYGTLSYDASSVRKRLHKQLVTNLLRWRLSGSAFGYMLEHFGFSYVPESDT